VRSDLSFMHRLTKHSLSIMMFRNLYFYLFFIILEKQTYIFVQECMSMVWIRYCN